MPTTITTTTIHTTAITVFILLFCAIGHNTASAMGPCGDINGTVFYENFMSPSHQAYVEGKNAGEYGEMTTYSAPLLMTNDPNATIVGHAAGYCITVAKATDEVLRTQLCDVTFQVKSGPFAGSTLAQQGEYYYCPTNLTNPIIANLAKQYNCPTELPENYGAYGSQVGNGRYTITGGTGCFAGISGYVYELETTNPSIWGEMIIVDDHHTSSSFSTKPTTIMVTFSTVTIAASFIVAYL